MRPFMFPIYQSISTLCIANLYTRTIGDNKQIIMHKYCPKSLKFKKKKVTEIEINFLCTYTIKID